MLPRCRRLGVTSEHPGDLDGAPFPVEPHDVRRSEPVGRVLLDPQVAPTPGCNLGEVRDHEHLVEFGHIRELRRHPGGNLPTDPGVDFVEDECGNLVDPCQDRLQREHDSREFAP